VLPCPVVDHPREVGLRILTGVFEPGPGAGGGTARSCPAAARPSREGSGAGSDESLRPGSGTSPFTLTAFQLEAVARARRILGVRGGVVLADAVGLGKTFVALRLVEEMLGTDGNGLVVAPAALRRMWRRQLSRLPGARQRVGVLSHTQLSRGARTPAGPLAGVRLIVVDEAHRFRNPRTRRYAALARRILDSGADGSPAGVLLITATPVNNSVADLYHLIRLFAPDEILGDVGVPSLRGAFEAATRAGGEDCGLGGLRTVVRHLVIRRTRGLVRDRFGETARPGSGVGFPRRASPVVASYPAPGMRELVGRVEALELASYDRDWTSGGRAGDAGGTRALLRLGLLKRLESSPAAARSSLERLRAFGDLVHEAAGAGRVVRPRDRPGAGTDADPLQLVMTDLVAATAAPGTDLDGLAASITRDRRRIDEMVRLLGGKEDPKLAALLDLVDTLATEPMLVFTEFRDTAAYLGRALSAARRVGRIDGTGAWLGRHPAGRRTVVERFAPVSNGRAPPPEREAVDILVATDVLAEGLNLQDARHVVSYDLPWNPVRLLQRIGRVDRLGSQYPEVVPHLFCPDEGLEEVLGLSRRLRWKLDGIVALVGEEGGEELLRALASEHARLPAVLDAAERDGSSDPMEALRTLWVRSRRGGGVDEVLPAARDRCARSVRGPVGTGQADVGCSGLSVATLAVEAGHPAAGLRALVLVAGRGAGRLVEVGGDGSVDEPGDASVAALASALKCADHGITSGDGASTAAVDAREIARRVTAACREREAVDPSRNAAPMPRHDTASRLALRLRAALDDAGSAAHATLLDRAEVVLTRLARPLPPGLEPEAEALLRWQPQGAAELIGRIEGVLRAAPASRPGSPIEPAMGVGTGPVAVLRIAPNPGPSPVDDPPARD
jgi:superfamily II DNA or RNA helicase